MRGKKKYPAAKYIRKKISCAALLQEKNICLVPLGGKKLLHSLNLPTPSPSKIKWSAPNCFNLPINPVCPDRHSYTPNDGRSAQLYHCCKE
jgi:hypothetical protein